jgi:pantoate--beta-alanine ligase
MRIVREIEAVRRTVGQARAKGNSIGFFPTLGGMHEGHLSMIRRARADNDFVVVSIFVNPTQFGVDEDLDAYPRQLEADAGMAEECGGDLVFAPSEAEMYAADAATYVEVEGLTDVL